MKNIKLIIAYDGTRYLGWQKTSIGPSVEGVLQHFLEKILQHPVILQAASRTDAGVHAVGQTVNFFTSKNLDLNRFKSSLNRLLPFDLVVSHIEQMPDSFHPTLNCISKEYRYYVCWGPLQMPQHRFYSWHYYYQLDLAAMRAAGMHFLGWHDFSAFCNAKNNRYKDFNRKIEEIEILEIETYRLCLKIKGPNFLYRMVRNIVGTLLHVGNQKINAVQIPEILQSKKRMQAGITAPAHGLFLHQIYY